MNYSFLKYPFIFLLSFLMLFSHAQQRTAPTCESFLIEKKIGKDLVDTFNGVYKNFNMYVNTSKAQLTIKKQNFLRMLLNMMNPDSNITGFRIYFAAENNGSSIPTFKLIFAPLNYNDDLDKRYYIITPDSNFKVITNPKEIINLSNQIRLYNVEPIKYTNVILGSPNTNNYMFRKPGMIDEIKHFMVRETGNKEIYAIKFELGAYFDPQGPYYHYMMVGFSFIDKNEKQYYPSDNSGDISYGCEIDKTLFQKYKSTFVDSSNLTDEASFKKSYFFLSVITGDTGTPCPPGTGCSGTSLPK